MGGQQCRCSGSWPAGARGCGASLDPTVYRTGLGGCECILDGIDEREALILATEGALEVIQIQGPHHGTCQLLVFQVLHLGREVQRGRAGFSRAGCVWGKCYSPTPQPRPQGRG